MGLPFYCIDNKAPPTAPNSTTIHGGIFQKVSMLNKIAANAKSSARKIELVQIGLYNAASKIPMTAALTPMTAPLIFG